MGRTTLEKGTLKAGLYSLYLLTMITAIPIMKYAKRVPIFINSARIFKGRKPAKRDKNIAPKREAL